MKTRILSLILGLALAGAVAHAQTSTPPTPPPPPNMPHTPALQASDVAKAVAAILQQFDAKRDQAIADRQALIEKIKAATTDAERQALMTQLRTEMAAHREEMAALGKQIREELRKLRQQRQGGG
ncbi:MAG: hypothetical protein JSR48_10605 [Verrucomicrobia bacterium]|nr:hypothetical protein [Verrucomicrobiota bacterium]